MPLRDSRNRAFKLGKSKLAKMINPDIPLVTFSSENVPTCRIPGSDTSIAFAPGTTTIFVGANGSGKSMLAVKLEGMLSERAHRISAQRKIVVDTDVDRIDEVNATVNFLHGHKGSKLDSGVPSRWETGVSNFALDDGGALMQLVFARFSKTTTNTYMRALKDGIRRDQVEESILHILKRVFESVLPNLILDISDGDIRVINRKSTQASSRYKTSSMSDGEKSVLYIVCQALVAQRQSVLILDEPEIHIHRSILSRMWNALESERSDCAFVLITHDLEFAASRTGDKYVIESYDQENWDLRKVEESEGFEDSLLETILGAPRKVLFIEGAKHSLDAAIYRSCFPGWQIVPRNSCKDVIHATKSFNTNRSLSHIMARGLIDSDGFRVQQAMENIEVLPVVEIENLLLLPKVSTALLRTFLTDESEISRRLSKIKTTLWEKAEKEETKKSVVNEICKRHVDRALKALDLSNIDSILNDNNYLSNIVRTTIDTERIKVEIEQRYDLAIQSDDIEELLKVFDSKATVLEIALKYLTPTKSMLKKNYFSWIGQQLYRYHNLREAFINVLPRMGDM